VLNRDGNLSLSWTHLFSANTLFELHPYFRDTTQHLSPSPNDAPLHSTYDSRIQNYGFVSSLSYELGSHSIKTGVQAFAFPLRQSLSFSVTDATYNAPFLNPDGTPDPNDNPANANNPNPDYNPNLRPFDATRIDPATGL